jgi:hypothetical protein
VPERFPRRRERGLLESEKNREEERAEERRFIFLFLLRVSSSNFLMCRLVTFSMTHVSYNTLHVTCQRKRLERPEQSSRNDLKNLLIGEEPGCGPQKKARIPEYEVRRRSRLTVDSFPKDISGLEDDGKIAKEDGKTVSTAGRNRNLGASRPTSKGLQCRKIYRTR